MEADELKGAIRRALLVFAAGGELRRDPTPTDPAVIELAADLDTPQRRSALGTALEMLEPNDEVLVLRRDPELAWRAFACSLLADALGED